MLKEKISKLKENKFCLKLTKSMQLLNLNVYKFIYKHHLIILMFLISIISLIARFIVSSYPTNDIVYIVYNWIEQIKNLGFSNFYKANADYSTFYLFILALFSLLPGGKIISLNNYTPYAVNYLYYLKTILFMADFFIAIGIYKIIKYITNSSIKATIGYIIFICLPVQYIDSAIWGNCDSLYVVFIIWSLYFILKRKDFLAYLMFGFSIIIKINGIIFLPFLVYLIFNRRIKLYPIIMVFIGLFISFLPAYFCGANFSEPFKYISVEFKSYSGLNLGCANFWSLTGFYFPSIINKGSTLIAITLIGCILAITFILKIKLTDENIVFLATFLSGITIFFLPHMHERYFYLLDTLICLYTICKKKHYYFIILMQISSGICYYHYLSANYIFPSLGENSIIIATFINIFILTYLFIDLLKLDRYESFDIMLKSIEEDIKNISGSN